MATTTNFGWETPDDTDLVKDGAAAIRTVANSIDTSFVDLKGGTTGQILSKASNTDLDYTWINNDVGDITAVTAGTGITGGGSSGAVTITNDMATKIDAKGDLVVGTGADTYDRLAIGSNDQVLTADSTAATGMKWAAVPTGGMTLLNTGGTTLTGSSITISSIPSTYNALYIVVRGFRPVTDGTQLRMRTNVSTSNYATIYQGDAQDITGTDPSWYLTGNQDNATSFSSAICWIYDYANTTTIKFIDTKANVTNNNTTSTNFNYLTQRFGVLNNTAAITDLVFSCSSGNFNAGTVFVYGVK